MRPFLAMVAFALSFLCAGCATVDPACDPLPEDRPCETLRDCPPSGIACVIGVCEDHQCEWLNLAASRTLPVDPDSGLPIGKECHTSGGGGEMAPLACAYDLQCQHLGTASCVVGQCQNSTCEATQAQDGSACVDGVSTAGICFDGECYDAGSCDDGNECTHDWLSPNGTCVGFPKSEPQACPFGSGTGTCFQGQCACDSDDDCDDADPSTLDQCWDLQCYH